MIHNQYNYAKDNRTDQQYQSYFSAGTHNEIPAMEQLRIDRFIQTGQQLRYTHHEDKQFQTEDGSWEYQADYTVYYDGKVIPTEVKVQMTSLKETIDLKAGQIDRLIPIKGVVLYATKDRYSLTYAKQIKQLGQLIRSTRFKDKLVYQVNVNDLVWEYWVHKPDFKSYR